MKIGVLVAALLLGLYIIHFAFCFNSPLPEFTRYFANSDMNANLEWAKTIREQGWLNPHPYHPYNDWMQEIASRETWHKWWGGDATYQQSPLFAYILALFLSVTNNLIYFHFFQCIAMAFLCLMLALLAAKTFQNKTVGWVTLVIAGLYAPFYGYSWPLLRDPIGWIVIVATLFFLSMWQQARNKDDSATAKSFKIAPQKFHSTTGPVIIGILLGIGLLARETFYATIPLTLIALFWICRKHQSYRSLGWILLGLVLSISPLILRNVLVKAPLLSTSNRFAENFIEGNAASAKPAVFFIPYETGDILKHSEGKPLKVVSETVATQPSLHRLWLLQIKKVVALFDPYEPSDNISLYFLEDISPFVRFGLRHWMIFIPGLGGLFLGIYRRDSKQIWFWIFLSSLMASLFLTTVLSRYRQALALLWIPWASYFIVNVAELLKRKSYIKFGLAFSFLIMGWWLCLGPFSIRPRTGYYRKVEYDISAKIYSDRGEKEKAQEWLRRFQKRI